MKKSVLFAHLFVLAGVAMFLNAGYSMLSYRRNASEEGVKAPLDVQIEVLIALVCSVFGAIFAYSDFENLSLMHSYKRKTPEQVHQGRKAFRNVMQTRGNVISKVSKIPKLEDCIK